jgi:hypothetical protein
MAKNFKKPTPNFGEAASIAAFSGKKNSKTCTKVILDFGR